jgi:hypothetical protein
MYIFCVDDRITLEQIFFKDFGFPLLLFDPPVSHLVRGSVDPFSVTVPRDSEPLPTVHLYHPVRPCTGKWHSMSYAYLFVYMVEN